MAENKNISSDILQQALENSGLSSTTTAAAEAAAPAAPIPPAQATAVPKRTTTLSVRDAATGAIKRHVVRSVSCLWNNQNIFISDLVLLHSYFSQL